MRKVPFFLFFFLLGFGLRAQFGLTALYNHNELRQQRSSQHIDRTELLGNESATEVALHYWFRLPKQRIEFQPTLYAAFGMGDLDYQEYGLQFKTNLYLFDLVTDCDCPTFGKQGPRLDKGFFLQLAPGVAAHDYSLYDGTVSDQTINANLAVALGLDFGLSNLLTLTPIAGLRYTFGGVGPIELTDATGAGAGTLSHRLLTYQFGLQATFRLDKRRY
jgi:hypothetical protein